jgi:hypothetical protein
VDDDVDDEVDCGEPVDGTDDTDGITDDVRSA